MHPPRHPEGIPGGRTVHGKTYCTILHKLAEELTSFVQIRYHPWRTHFPETTRQAEWNQ
jgi:hypothetical protein